MKPVSLADITYEQGLTLLALRKQGLDSGKIRRMPKEAMDNTYILRGVGETVLEKAAAGGWLDNLTSTLSDFSTNASNRIGGAIGGAADSIENLGQGLKNRWQGINAPTRDILKKSLIGAGIGGLGGLGASAINRDRNWGRNALMGGIAGGAIGGGMGVYQNPDAAEAVQNRARELMNPQTGEGGAKPEASSAPAAEPPKTPGFAADEAKRILGVENPQMRMSEVNRLQQTADSYAPELVHGGAGAAGVAGTGYGLSKIRNLRGFDPSVMATKLQSNIGKIDPDTLKTLLGVDADAVRNMSKDQVIELLAKGGFKKNMLGGLSPAAEGNLKTLLRSGGKGMGGVEALDDVLVKGFRGNRPIRAGGAAGLLGTAGIGGYALLQNYLKQREARQNAQHVLEQLKYQLGNQ